MRIIAQLVQRPSAIRNAFTPPRRREPPAIIQLPQGGRQFSASPLGDPLVKQMLADAEAKKAMMRMIDIMKRKGLLKNFTSLKTGIDESIAKALMEDAEAKAAMAELTTLIRKRGWDKLVPGGGLAATATSAVDSTVSTVKRLFGFAPTKSSGSELDAPGSSAGTAAPGKVKQLFSLFGASSHSDKPKDRNSGAEGKGGPSGSETAVESEPSSPQPSKFPSPAARLLQGRKRQ
ncbi:hypothetical protein DFJ73DRAFT_810254 [Zopfochytrium polystomum]|nr:hypothetical protein DFJ73DRAFT_810254 [Zopfochytrium polystomum]